MHEISWATRNVFKVNPWWSPCR